MKIIETTDSRTGVRLWQLGDDPLFTNHFYTDNPSFSADGKQFIFMGGEDYFQQCDIFLCDIPSQSVTCISPKKGIRAAVFSPVRPEVYFTIVKDGAFTLYRRPLHSKETSEVSRVEGIAKQYVLGAIDPAGGKYSTGLTRPDSVSAVIEIDLATGKIETIVAMPDVYNPHMNYSANGRWLSIQFNHAHRLVNDRFVRNTDPPGLKNLLRAWDRQKHELVDFPFGKAEKEDIQGHQCWAGNEMLIAAVFRKDKGKGPGSLWAAKPGDPAARLVSDAFDFRHPSATLDGKTIACDEWVGKDIYMVDAATNHHELLCHSRSFDWDKERNATSVSTQVWHPHPTISPDGRYVLFNSNRTGTPHACVAIR